MSDFKKTVIIKVPKSEEEVTADNLYWKKLQFPITVKEFGPVTDVNFSQARPHHFVVTSSTKVQIFDPVSSEVYRCFTRFQKVAYGGTLRHDGKLLAVGGNEGQIRLFDVEAKSMLRVFKGHRGAVHKCNFVADDKRTVSFSDDKSVIVWDVASEQQLVSFEEHDDYVRAGTVSQVNNDIIISGSYDHTVKIFDIRTKKSVMSFNHGYPVESVLLLPNGLVVASAGGTSVKLWDIMGSGKMLSNLNNHHKTVTSLCLASNNQRLLSGSLDRHVKIHDLTSFKVVHTLDYSSPILSVAVSPDDKTVVTGMADGLFSIQHRSEKKDKPIKDKQPKPYEKYLKNRNYTPAQGDIIVKEKHRKKLPKYDKLLKSFQSSKALDTVLKDYYQCRDPDVTINVIRELIRRGSIKTALSGRDTSSLTLILKFVVKYINDVRFSRILLDVAHLLLDIYGPEIGQSEKIFNLFTKLKDVTTREISFMEDVMKLQGTIELIIANSNQNNYTMP
ncbi:U3 small nucleolar RNA-associated protein 15 [Nymphon striatum]|nr:U3 small nucleolar RNA-associated protein 15 [Nymphon striatum]